MTRHPLETEITDSLTHAVDHARLLAISVFTQELMVALAKENYYLDDLLDALADYANQREDRREDWREVARYLSEASTAAAKTRTDLIDRAGEQNED
jgi:hypothetical protein